MSEKPEPQEDGYDIAIRVLTTLIALLVLAFLFAAINEQSRVQIECDYSTTTARCVSK